MFVHQLDGLKKLGIPVRRWGDSFRVKIRNKDGRWTYVSDISKRSVQTGIVKAYKKVFPRNSSEGKRVGILKDYLKKPVANYTKNKQRTKEFHTFENMPTKDVFSKLEEVLKSQKKAFKVSVRLGYSLINIQTGERKYWSPGPSTNIFDDPIAINSKSDINSKIMEKIKHIDFATKINYPSSAYKLEEINAFQTSIYYRDHKLGDSDIKIPEVIKSNKHVINFPNTQNKCAFHCIAYHLQTENKDCRRIQALVKARFREYCEFKGVEYSVPVFKSFEGVDLLEFDELEECFQLNINVFEMDINTIEVSRIRESQKEFPNTINILDYNGHAMYIPRIDMFQSKYCCSKCDMIFPTCEKLKNHKKNKCEVSTFDSFVKVPSVYSPPTNKMKSLMSKYNVKGIDHYMDHFITYDFEALLFNIVEERGKSTEYTSRHIPVSVSVCDSLTGQSQCFVSEDPKYLLEQMFAYINQVSKQIHQYNVDKFETLIREVIFKNGLHGSDIAGCSISDRLFADDIDNWIGSGKYASFYDFLEHYNSDDRYYKALSQTLAQVPLLGFNSGRYDLNLIKNDLFAVLGPENIKMVIKNPSYMCILTKNLKILDISNYLPAGTSYADYLKTYLGACKCEDKISCVCGLGKGLFPYEYLSSFDKLTHPLPPKDAFDSSLRSTKISDEDYERVQWVWDHYQMKTLKDLLIWYNNLDVKPFVDAVKNQRELYKTFGLDMLMDGVSLPSLSEKIMYQCSNSEMKPIEYKSGKPFQFPVKRLAGYRKQDADKNLMFHLTMSHLQDLLVKQRYSCSHCGIELNEENVSADRINNSKGHEDNNIMISCVHCNVARKDMSINGFRYKKKLEHNADRLVFSIDDDNKDIYYKMKANIAGGPSIIFNRYAKRNETFIRSTPSGGSQTTRSSASGQLSTPGKLVKKVIGYDANALYLWALGNEMPCGRLTTIPTYEGIIEDIKADKIFGFLECDIETPSHLKEYFSEMTPIFKNTEIDPCDRALVGDHMFEYNEASYNRKTQKSRKLIGSYFGSQILIYTPLLKWYLAHGLVITNTYGFIQAKSHKAFASFKDRVSDARRAGDVDASQAMIAEMMKLVGNSAFGRSGMDKSKHKDVCYASDDKTVRSIVELPQFHDVEELNGSYEITKKKRRIKMNNSIHLSIAIYQLAKLRMLQFYYDCIDYYFDRSDFQYQEMDTDSAYISFSAENPFEELIKPELVEHYQKHKYEWFPRDDTEENAAFDRRTPGLFKEEWRGDAIVSLSSKNYICYLPDEKHKIKISSKGVQGSNDKGLNRRNASVLNPDSYENVVRNRISLSATNKGFRIDKQTQSIITYQQTKIGLSYYYDKRRVLSDGITTEPLDI